MCFDAKARAELLGRSLERCVQADSVVAVELIAVIHKHEFDFTAFWKLGRFVENKPAAMNPRLQGGHHHVGEPSTGLGDSEVLGCALLPWNPRVIGTVHMAEARAHKLGPRSIFLPKSPH